jgi:hypothetical protein
MAVGFRHVSLVAAGLIVVLAVLLGSSAASSAAGPQAGSIRGVVPSRQAVKAAAASPQGTPPLIYHGGPVMHTNKTYAIYWVPSGYSVSANYRTIIDRYLGDVAAASGSTSNVYATDTQYYDTTNGNILNSSTFGGSYLDAQSLPASGCTDFYTTVCLTDAQLQTEVQRVATLNGWTVGPTSMFLMFTASGIGSCFDGSSSACAFTYYCAYHSNIGSGPGEILYSNQPYTMTVPAACDSGEHPNGDDADSVLNVASHEHNETITDPLGTAWWDSSGYENGDECAWDFGTALGSTGSSQYNQVINGNKYYLQQEWSNSDNACELTYGAAAPPPTVTSASPSSSVRGVVNVPITVNGANFVNGSAASFSGTYVQVNSTSYVSTTQLTANVTIHGVAALGARNVTVTNPGGASGTCTGCFSVVSSGGTPPTVTSTSPSSSIRGVVNKPVTVFGTGFTSGAKVSFSGTYVQVNSTSFVSSTQLTASVTIHGVAALGARDVTVTNTGGASGTCTGCFSVVSSGGTPPTVTSTSPNTLPRLSISKTVLVNGSGFVSGATVAFSGTYVQVNSVTFVNANQLSLSVTIHGVAATGARNVTVTNPGGASGTCTNCFTVT